MRNDDPMGEAAGDDDPTAGPRPAAGESASPTGDDPTADPAAKPVETSAAATTTRTSEVPTADANKWVTPGLAAYVVSVVALVLLGIVGLSLWELQTAGDTTPVADPNAGTIAALAGAAIAALSSLTAAYFGIKVATEQSSQSAATAAKALEVLGNSTSNGNPREEDF